MLSYKRRKLLQYGVAAAVLTATGMPMRAQTRGGTLSAAMVAQGADGWDARLFRDSFMIAVGQGAVFDCLTEVNADGTLSGELAIHWEASSDARVWTIDLRQGVPFHNGQMLVADDVLASIQWHMSDDVISGARPIVSMIERMDKLSDHQVQFTLHDGNADFPYLLSDYHLVIYPAEHLGEPIGTGLYQVASFVPGERFVGTRVPEHYKDGRAGWFDRVEFTAVPNDGQRLNALLTGRVDAMERVDLRAAQSIAGQDDMRLMNVVSNQHMSFSMPTKAAPFDDLHVRAALKHGIDRAAVVDDVLMGFGSIAADSPIGPANPYFDSTLSPLAYDPERAKWHLSQIGVDRIAVNLDVIDTAVDRIDLASQAYTSQAAHAGIDLSFGAAANAVSVGGWYGRATEDWMLTAAHQAGSPLNASQWEDREFDLLVRAARSELDTDVRRALYVEVQHRMRDHGGVVVPAFMNFVQAANTRIGVPDVVGNLWPMDNGRMAERWWRA